MKFKYDDWGWYAGPADDAEFDRVTETGPGAIPAGRVPGEPYPNWTGYEWTALSYVEPTPLPEPVDDHRLRWIDVGPFKDRLGADAPAIYASTHDACRGVVGLVEGRKYIDLADPRIGIMLGVLIATAQPAASPVWPGSGPMTAEKREAILNTPTAEHERHIKGLEG